MSGHTPGPWKWWTSNSWRRLKHDTGHGGTVNVLEPCVCPDGHPDLIVSEADMRLIAAAPDMLDLLKDTLPFVEDERIRTVESRALSDRIAAVIKQATGEV